MSNPIKAALSVTGATGAIVANKGFSGVTGGGGAGGGAAGVWDCTLSSGVAAGSCAVNVTQRGAAPAADGVFSVEHTSNTVKTVHYTVAGVATNVDFDLVLVDLSAAA